MKTAEQWLDSEQWHETGDRDLLKQIRSIQIDALRHAREIVTECGDDDLGHACVLAGLDKLIRELELK